MVVDGIPVLHKDNPHQFKVGHSGCFCLYCGSDVYADDSKCWFCNHTFNHAQGRDMIVTDVNHETRTIILERQPT